MKLILSFSLIAMISAGIYGVFDFSKDVKNGTLIDYRNNLHLANIILSRSEFSSSSSEELRKKVVTNVTKKVLDEREKAKKELKERLYRFSLSSFSREAPEPSDEEVKEYQRNQARLDSIKALKDVVVLKFGPHTSAHNRP
jgi:hypothetical protein